MQGSRVGNSCLCILQFEAAWSLWPWPRCSHERLWPLGFLGVKSEPYLNLGVMRDYLIEVSLSNP